MGKINYGGMLVVETARAKRNEALAALTSKPFDLNNTDQLAAIKKYTHNFEFNLNQMYIYQAMSEGLKLGGAAWLLGVFLPIPNAINYFISPILHLSAAAYFLERFLATGALLEYFGLTDFTEQLIDMKTLYNWCLKGGEFNYSAQIDNTDKLAQPEVQYLIKSIAPLCSVDFMLAWPRQTQNESKETGGGWYGVLSAGINAASSAYSLFSQAKPGVNLTKIKELKVAVETRGLDVGVMQGFKQAINYFSTNPEVREMMQAKVDMAKNIVPSKLIGQMVSLSN